MRVRLTLFFTFLLITNGQSANFPDCKSGPMSTFPICNQTLTSRVRAADLVSRLTTAEKISRLGNGSPGVDRLGLPGFQWWSEALHGVAYSPGVSFGGDLPSATSFPMPINLGASFNMSLVHQAAGVVSTEARAFNNEGRAGLVFFTPNINIFRDPRWGRGQETPGEDPFLTSSYVYALINGLQRGDDERYLKMAADCKHYAAYDLEHWNGVDRVQFNAIVSDQDLLETYLPPFESCIRDARVASIMCSYNAVNGIPSCANEFLLKTLAREAYHLDGFVVSDCDAVDTIISGHHYTQTPEDTVAVALHATTDLDCGGYYQQHTQAALDKQTIVEADIDQALERQFNVLVRLGYFDPPEQQPYRQLSAADVDTPASRQLALEGAQQSIVLLKNANKALPLNLNQLQNKKIALIGPSANNGGLMQGNYFGHAPFLIDPVTAFQNVTTGLSITVAFAHGCNINDQDQSGFQAAIALAQSSDVVIFVGGIDEHEESEGHDRTVIDFPGIQLALIQQLEKVVRSPLHVVLMNGGGVDLTYVRDSNQVGSLIWMGYAGQSGGIALANVVFGQYNPGGRLPITYYPASYLANLSMFDMQMRPSPTNPGRTYKFYTGQPVFEFGSGLSYTTFNYTWYNNSISSVISIRDIMKNHDLGEKFAMESYRVNVTNTGTVFGDDVVLAYITPPSHSLHDPSPPLKRLFGFERVHLNVGQTTQVYFPLVPQALITVGSDGHKWLEPGAYRIMIGKEHMHTVYLRGTSTQWA